MSNYCAELSGKEKDETFHSRWVEYQRERAKEISDIIGSNPIQFEEIKIGESLVLYAPLNGISKIRFDNKGESHIIKELFKPSAGYYNDLGIWSLFCNDEFSVYDKNPKSFTLRIDKPTKDLLPLFPKWIDFRYFSKRG